MFNKEKRANLTGKTVKDLIEVLQTAPRDAELNCYGDNYIWVHIDDECKIVNIDVEDFEDAYIEATIITDEQWKEAYAYLKEIIIRYTETGWTGRFALDGFLLPLKKRYDSGERTVELYNEIMACE